jgi:hypothetical protein
MQTIIFQDETVSGDILRTIEIMVENEMMMVRDLIAARVRKEVETYNAQAQEYFQGLIQPSDAEATLNGYTYKMRNKRYVDPEKQVFVAWDAFQKNRFFIMIDNKQVADLDEAILVEASTKVSFLRLMPLVGG